MLTVLGFLNPIGVVGSMAKTKAHRGKPIWAAEGGAELPLTNIVNGPGKYSLDCAFGLRLPGWLSPRSAPRS